MSESAFSRAVRFLRDAQRVVVFTGAGMSADSGVPTFRSGRNKLWGGKRLEKLGSINGYREHPDEAWRWYQARAERARALAPHAGYRAIAAMAAPLENLTVITQNIDGLHFRADNPNVLELHGSLREVRCLQCQGVRLWPSEIAPVAPRCDCGGVLCPRVVLFGEDLPYDIWEEAEEAAKRCDVLLSVGSSHVVNPAARIPRSVLGRLKPVIVINTRKSDTLPNAVFVPGRAARILPSLVHAAWPEAQAS